MHSNHTNIWYQHFLEDHFSKWWWCLALKRERLQWGGGRASGERKRIRGGWVSEDELRLPPKFLPGSAWLTVMIRDGNEGGGEGRRPRKPVPGVSRVLRAEKHWAGRELRLPGKDFSHPSREWLQQQQLLLLFYGQQQVRSPVFSSCCHLSIPQKQGQRWLSVEAPVTQIKADGSCQLYLFH